MNAPAFRVLLERQIGEASPEGLRELVAAFGELLVARLPRYGGLVAAAAGGMLQAVDLASGARHRASALASTPAPSAAPVLPPGDCA